MIPAILRVVPVLNRRRVSGTRCARQAIGSSGSDHSSWSLDGIGTIYHSHTVISHHLSGSWQAGNRWWRRLLLRLECLECKVCIRAGSIVLPGIAGDQAFLYKKKNGKSSACQRLRNNNFTYAN